MTIEALHLKSDGPFPNNPKLPLLVYRQAVSLDPVDPASTFEGFFSRNAWSGTWRDGVYAFHHFHSNAHEALGVASGTAEIQFGGPNGPIVEVRAGDLVVLPAGTTHRRVKASADLLVVGAYPDGQGDYDLLRGDAAKSEKARQRIATVRLPAKDPVGGKDGPLMERWSAS